MNVLLLSASPREGSLTRRFCDFLGSRILQHGFSTRLDILDFDSFDIPVVGKGRFDPTSLTEFQQNLVHAWQQADLVLIASPEYNWTANAELFVMFDRLGTKDFRGLFQDKTFAAIGVSSGRGGRQPALDIHRVLSKVISFMGGFSIVSPRILEAHEVGKNLDPMGNFIGNPIFEATTMEFLRYTLEMGRRWKSGIGQLTKAEK